MAKIVQDEGVDDEPQLSSGSGKAYVLACSVCADISTQLIFLSENLHVRDMPNNVGAKDFADEAIRIRDLIDYRLNPCADTLLASFFLYDY